MRRRQAAEQLTPFELEIMKILWESGADSVQGVLGKLPADRPFAYNTVQTMLNVLHRKGKVRRVLQGRAFVYEPSVSRVDAARQAVGDLVQRMFDGSPESLVLSLVEARQLTPETLARLSALLDEGREEEGDGHGDD